MSGQQRQHYVVLDGLRGVAALAVVIVHAAPTFGGASPQHASLAVDFFFCLSGFVVALAYDRQLSEGRLNAWGFAKKRFARLYPMVLLGGLLGGVATLLSATHGAPEPLSHVALLVAGSLTLVPTGLLLHMLTFPSNVPFWSLSFEAMANAVYALTARVQSRGLWLGVLAISGALLAIFTIVGGTLQDFGVDGPHYLGGVPRTAFSFLAGVMLWRTRLHERLPAAPSVLTAAVLALMLLGPDVSQQWPYDLAGALILSPLLVALGAKSTSSARLDRVWATLGAISYPLYAIHLPVLRFVAKLDHHLLHLQSPAAAMALGVSISALSAWLALKLYDQPVRAVISSRVGKPATRSDRACIPLAG